jgi:altronate dehydratase
MKPNVIIINPADNVAIALTDIKNGEAALLPDGLKLIASSYIPYSHKIALAYIALKQEIIKYGEVIGEAKVSIKKGEWVHTHNLDIE